MKGIRYSAEFKQEAIKQITERNHPYSLHIFHHQIGTALLWVTEFWQLFMDKIVVYKRSI